ncbi:MAG: DUF4124 domain-containing protein [Gammaproteobacteria bacterium]|nr:DUF4124 domain-containing protein [Gammaproteobacteria bacterium]
MIDRSRSGSNQEAAAFVNLQPAKKVSGLPVSRELSRSFKGSSTVALAAVYSMLLVLSLSADVMAATYKCIDENGDVTYSQQPCRKNEKTDKLLKNGKKPVQMEDCKFAGAFSQVIFGHMRSGLDTQQLFDRYGGASSISRSTLGVINYVYSFKHSETMQPDRLAQLTVARCNAQAFGTVSCEDFPREFQQMIFSCDDEQRKEAMRLQQLFDQGAARQYPIDNSGNAAGYGLQGDDAGNQERDQARERKKNEKEQARIERCRENYQAEIESIDDRMSRGYTASLGEELRDRRRMLVKKLVTECR